MHHKRSILSRRNADTNCTADLSIESLEARVMLTASLEYQPQQIADPFVDGAVTLQDMVTRADHTPYLPGELVVAVQLPNSPQLPH